MFLCVQRHLRKSWVDSIRPSVAIYPHTVLLTGYISSYALTTDYCNYLHNMQQLHGQLVSEWFEMTRAQLTRRIEA